jgi:hypothetical protein
MRAPIKGRVGRRRAPFCRGGTTRTLAGSMLSDAIHSTRSRDIAYSTAITGCHDRVADDPRGVRN